MDWIVSWALAPVQQEPAAKPTVSQPMLVQREAPSTKMVGMVLEALEALEVLAMLEDCQTGPALLSVFEGGPSKLVMSLVAKVAPTLQ